MPVSWAAWLLAVHPVWGGFIAAFVGMVFILFALTATQSEFWRSIWGTIGGVALAFGPGAYVWMPVVLETLERSGQAPRGTFAVAYPMPYVGWALGMGAGVVGWWLIIRRLVPWLEKLKHKFTMGFSAQRETRTDIRTVTDQLPDSAKDYDPTKHFKQGKVFLGIDRAHKPVYMAYDTFRRCHIQLVGTTGAGKGAAAGVLLSQALRAGEAVIVMDPKDDEWAPHVLRQAAEAAGRPFALIDLRQEAEQINLIRGATAAEVEELLVAGLGLSDRGDMADHYRVKDRKAARELALRVLSGNPGATLADMAEAAEADKWMQKNAEGFVNRLVEIAAGGTISAKAGGADLAALIEAGGAIYVVGSMRHGRILRIQRMLLVRLMQIVESRPRLAERPRQVCIFLDELKAHISRPALEMLGAIRDKGAHLVLAHQAVADLRDVPADLEGDAVVGAVVENCALRVAYRVQDPDTAEWLGRMTGKILVDDEARRIEVNGALVETYQGQRTITQAERARVDENMFLSLPFRVAVLFTPGGVDFGHVCPVPAEKRPLAHVGQGQKPAQPAETNETTAAPPPASHMGDLPDVAL